MKKKKQDIEAWEDPIVKEVRSAREHILALAQGDIEKLCKRLRRRQKSRGKKVVSRSPRRSAKERAVA
jgi:hypothetical protein